MTMLLRIFFLQTKILSKLTFIDKHCCHKRGDLFTRSRDLKIFLRKFFLLSVWCPVQGYYFYANFYCYCQVFCTDFYYDFRSQAESEATDGLYRVLTHHVKKSENIQKCLFFPRSHCSLESINTHKKWLATLYFFMFLKTKCICGKKSLKKNGGGGGKQIWHFLHANKLPQECALSHKKCDTRNMKFSP